MNEQVLNETNTVLSSNDKLTMLLRQHNMNTWSKAIAFITNLPYGRNSSRHNLVQVVLEKKGTCSSKHALLALVAQANKIANVQLVMGIYKVTTANTQQFATQLKDAGLDYFPEAHCYLKIGNLRFDFTTPKADIREIENDIIYEEIILPAQVAEYKVQQHKKFIAWWIDENAIGKTFDEIWVLREQFIKQLTL